MKNKKPLTLTAVLFILIAANLMRTSALQNVKTVDLLQFLACGALIGVFISRLFMQKNSQT